MSTPSRIQYLVIAVVQDQDAEAAIKALNAIDILCTQVSSSGGFLGQRNTSLLIGLHDGQEQEMVQTLRENCSQRVEYIATPLEGAPYHLTLATPINVGGATIFKLAVERYEEI